MIIDPVKVIGEEPSVKRALGVSCLEYETTIPTRFMCGTEQGLVIGGNRKGKNAVEKLPGRVINIDLKFKLDLITFYVFSMLLILVRCMHYREILDS
jgi:hypothetical protein